jgi:hypothetical protein
MAKQGGGSEYRLVTNEELMAAKKTHNQWLLLQNAIDADCEYLIALRRGLVEAMKPVRSIKCRMIQVEKRIASRRLTRRKVETKIREKLTYEKIRKAREELFK